ncbi:MAG: hypothetical protein AAF959_22825, partial [Cyanobacteria bacterium P01_D01_bin.56]
MVRRLLQHIVRWIRRFISQLQGTASRKTAPTKPQKPTAYQRLKSLPSINSESLHSSQSSAPTEELPITEIPQQAAIPEKELNPASPRATNPSNFQVFLSDYQRQPNAAIQDLNQQLVHGDTGATLIQFSRTDRLENISEAAASQTERYTATEATPKNEEASLRDNSSNFGTVAHETIQSSYPDQQENHTHTPERKISHQHSLTDQLPHQSYIQLSETTGITSDESFQGIQSHIHPIETDITTAT